MLLVLSVASAQTTNLRALQESVNVNEYYDCVKENSECKSCPGSCMELVNNNTECMLKNCYSWKTSARCLPMEKCRPGCDRGTNDHVDSDHR